MDEMMTTYPASHTARRYERENKGKPGRKPKPTDA